MEKIDSSWYKCPNNTPEHISAGGVVIRKENDIIHIALIREKNIPRYVLPKGHVEKGENIEEAAIREVAEETGITGLKNIGFLGVKERMEYGRESWKKTYYYLFITKTKSGKQLDNKNYGLKWFQINSLPDMYWPEQKELIIKNANKIRNIISSL